RTIESWGEASEGGRSPPPSWLVASPALHAGGDAAQEDSPAVLAIRRLEERLAKDPRSFAPLADAYRNAGRIRDAIKLCRDGLARFPKNAAGRLILAKALREDGDLEGALVEVSALLAGNPADAQGHRLAGELTRQAGRLPVALTHFSKAAA